MLAIPHCPTLAASLPSALPRATSLDSQASCAQPDDRISQFSISEGEICAPESRSATSPSRSASISLLRNRLAATTALPRHVAHLSIDLPATRLTTDEDGFTIGFLVLPAGSRLCGFVPASHISRRAPSFVDGVCGACCGGALCVWYDSMALPPGMQVVLVAATLADRFPPRKCSPYQFADR